MITYDDDNITLVFPNGERRIYLRGDSTRSLDRDQADESGHFTAWLRRTDEAMFANYYEP